MAALPPLSLGRVYPVVFCHQVFVAPLNVSPVLTGVTQVTVFLVLTVVTRVNVSLVLVESRVFVSPGHTVVTRVTVSLVLIGVTRVSVGLLWTLKICLHFPPKAAMGTDRIPTFLWQSFAQHFCLHFQFNFRNL